MGKAINGVAGISLATKESYGITGEIPEIGVSDGKKLSDQNVHFGLGSEAFVSEKNKGVFFRQFLGSNQKPVDMSGPRALDKVKRGGILSKELYSDPVRALGSSRANKIHFHLDGMGELSIDFFWGDHRNLTDPLHVALRGLYANWFGKSFFKKTTFYNGYTSSGAAVIVEPPWVPFWEPDKRNCSVCGQQYEENTYQPIYLGFGTTHHCRYCGHVVCDDCSKERANIDDPANGLYMVRRSAYALGEFFGSYRVCDNCYNNKIPEQYLK